MRNLKVFKLPPKPDAATLAVGVPVILFVLSFALGGWTAYPKGLSQFRNPLLISVGLFILLLGSSYLRRSKPGLVAEIDRRMEPDALRRLLAVFFALAFLKASFLDYFSFHVHALDSSIYDYAMMNTLRGRFMESITGIDHFAIHATPVLFLLLPLHALFHSPLFAVLFQAVGLFVGALLFDRCLKARDIRGWPRLGLFFAYLNCVWLSRTLHYGFHIEILYPIAFFLVDLAIHRRKSDLFFYAGIVFLLSMKEDAPFHAAALALAYFVTGRVSRSRFAIVCVLSVATLIFYLKFLIPAHAEAGTYRFAASASGAGKDIGSALQFLVGNPGHFLQRFFTGAWWKILLPCFGILAAAPAFWIASAPLLAIYSLVGDSQMFYLTIYYGIPLLGFLGLGLADGFARIRGTRWAALALIVAIGALSLTGSAYLVFRRTDFQLWRDVRAELALLPKHAAICTPGILVPQLPYGGLRLLDSECVLELPYAILLSRESTFFRFPLNETDENVIRERVREWKRLDSGGANRTDQIEVWARVSQEDRSKSTNRSSVTIDPVVR
jgi:uncharacterized membrane protein